MTTPSEVSAQVLKSLIFDVALKAVAARMALMAPFLGLPVVSQVFLFVLKKIAGYFYDELALFVEFQIIDFQTDQQRHAYQDSVDALKKAMNPAQGAPDAAQVEKAKEEVRRRLADLVRIPH